MSLKSTSFPKELWWKLFISWTKQFKRNQRQFCRQKTAEYNNAKTNVFPNIPSTFLFFKANPFLQIFFPRNLLFQQVLRTPFFLNSKCLTASNKKIQIPLFINRFVSLIKLKMYWLINYWTNTCKFEIYKITYSKW